MHISIAADAMPSKTLRSHHFDPTDGLDITEAAMVAIINNPDLKLARDDADIARAQAFAAGLLPEPQISLSRDLSNSGGPGSTSAYSLGLNYDINALFLYPSTRKTENSETQKIDLNLLWQELQVVAQAQLLFIKLTYTKNLKQLLTETEILFSQHLENSKIALQKGLQTGDVLVADMSVLQDEQRQLFELTRTENQAIYDFNSLLGLDTDTKVNLQNSNEIEAIDEQLIQQEINDLQFRRPDLLALETGYNAQDQRYYGAILGQFPALNLGLTRSRDSSGIYANSVGVGISLPLLNRNRANINIEKATRQRLYDEYQQRVTTSRNEISLILNEQKLNQQQLLELGNAITEFGKALTHSEVAYHAGNIDSIVYSNARMALLTKQIEYLNLQQTLMEQRIALQTLLAADLPTQHLSR